MDTNLITNDILSTLENAWNKADGNAFAQPFTEDADFVDITGSLHKSKAAIGPGHQAIFDTIYKGSTVKYDLVRSAMISDSTILAHASASLDAPTGPIQGKNGSTITLVINKAGNEWLVRAFHNTLVMKR
ncbi:MAG: hypothetical protein K0Q79_1109 [Flavipsychrobacter sp.]|jgi:uncharacterized protein (TIGR02246 family)|nr:hypothetical protein [Flavipsychrobacter sp.]